MIEITRKFSEVIAIAKLEPKLKCVYVEGIDDVYLINNFCEKYHDDNIGVYGIESVDYSEVYSGLDVKYVNILKNNNKERVIYLAQVLETEITDSVRPIICVVDIDWDNLLGNLRKSQYLVYTDYNSMELYLFNKKVIEKFFQQGLRINGKIDYDTLMTSIADVTRKIFHIHCLMHEECKSILQNDKDFKYNKETSSCALDFDKYWQKTIMKCCVAGKANVLKKKYTDRILQKCDSRMEMRGQDFVCYLYLCVKRMKSNLCMNKNEFANVFWQYIDYDDLAKENLFKRIIAL